MVLVALPLIKGPATDVQGDQLPIRHPAIVQRLNVFFLSALDALEEGPGARLFLCKDIKGRIIKNLSINNNWLLSMIML